MNRIIIVPFLLLYSFVNAQFIMFPGDTNNDGIANYYDILPIGLAYDSLGPPREPANINWEAQDFFPWGQILPFSGVEYGFIDCDGNGIIDSLDIEAIAVNYDSMQMEANPPPMPYELPDTLFTTNIPELSITFSLDTVMVTDTFFAQIDLIYSGPGDIEPALGIAFGLEYNAELVKDSFTVIFPDIMPEDDLMFVYAASHFVGFHRAPPMGRIEVGAAGRGKNAINGPRPLAKVKFIVEDVIIRSVEKEFAFSVTDILLINNEERVLEVNFFSDTIILVDPFTNFVNELNLDELIRVFPNPANDYLFIETETLILNEIQIFNQLGELVDSKKNLYQKQIQINVESLPHGIYFAKISTDEGILIKKICFF